MIKKLSLILALWSAVALSSCSKEEEAKPLGKGVDEVTFSLEVDDLATRAETSPTRYIMELYVAGDDGSETLYKRTEHAKKEFTMTLNNDVDYRSIFYADFGTPADETEDGNDYNAQSLKAIFVQSQPTNVCYSTCEEFTYNSAAATKPYLSPTLTHAVAQVNFVQEEEEFVSGNNTLKAEFLTTYIFDAAHNEVADFGASFTYTFSDIAQESGSAVIGSSYIFADKKQQSVIDIDVTFNDDVPKSLTNIPFQINHRTNITGYFNNLYNSQFTISSDDVWGGDNEQSHDGDGGNVTTPPAPLVAYEVGDNYPDDENAVGVVYEVWDNGTHGKVIGEVSAEGYLWSLEANLTNADSYENGLENMRTIQALSSDFSDFPAFEYCDKLNKAANANFNSSTAYADGATGVWYLPAMCDVAYYLEGDWYYLKPAITDSFECAIATSTEFDIDGDEVAKTTFFTIMLEPKANHPASFGTKNDSASAVGVRPIMLF